MDFESLAVEHIRNLCSRTENLTSDTPVGDKGISFDGKIILYNSNGRTIQGYKYDIPVQVKSLQVESFSGEDIKYARLSRGHYINYVSRGGCLLFVVEVDIKTGESNAYFKCLLPINLRDMLNENPANNITINLQRISSKDHLVKICKFMHEHMKLQHNDSGYVSVDNRHLNDVSLTPISPDINKVKSHHNFFETPYFAYGKIGHIILPVEGLFHVSQIEFYDESLIFTVGQFDFGLASTYSRKKDSWNLNIENIIEIEGNKNSKMKIDYKFINFGHIDLMIKTFDSIYKFLTIGSFRNKYLQVNINTSEINKEDDSIIFYKRVYQELNRFKKSIDLLSIKNNIYVKNERDLSKIATLNKIIIDYEISGTSLEEMKGYNLFLETIGDDKFLLFFDPRKSTLINPFKEFSDNQNVYFKDQDKHVSTSFFLVLEPEYFKASNFDFEAVESSLQHIDLNHIDRLFPNINQFILNLLKTYDVLLETKYLKLVESIYYKTYRALGDEQDRIILLINYLQSIKRRNGTIKKFTPELYKLLENKNNNFELQFCIQVLLEDKEEAYFNFKNLEETTQLNYINYPIYTLYKKL